MPKDLNSVYPNLFGLPRFKEMIRHGLNIKTRVVK